jgi:hypothetical protein
MRRRAPDVLLWLLRLDDASGVEGEWMDPAKPLPPAIPELLRLAADVYLPFLAANFEATQHGDKEVSLQLLSQTFTQAPFRYQAKCYDGLRKKFAALPRNARQRIEPLLRETGCLMWLG